MREIGSYRTTNADGRGFADTWSFKAPTVSRDRRLLRLRQRHRARPRRLPLQQHGEPSTSPGKWMTPKQAATFLSARPRVGLTQDTAFFCLLPPS